MDVLARHLNELLVFLREPERQTGFAARPQRLDVRVFRTASECIAAAKAAYAPLLTGGRH